MKQVHAILNLHREGQLLIPSFRSIQSNLEILGKRGIQAGLIAVLDRPDADTRDVIQSLQKKMNFEWTEVDFGDLSQSRNHGVQLSDAEYIGFLDGDDLWCDNWLFNCFQHAKDCEPHSIFHPSWNVVFGTKQMLFPQPDQTQRTLTLDGLRSSNYWTALSFSRRQTYLDHPYRPNQISKGLGFEDWSWNCETIEHGYIHRTVPETTHFIRYKEKDSLRDHTNETSCLRTPFQLVPADSPKGKRPLKPSCTTTMTETPFHF